MAVAPAIGLNVVPESVETSHCTVGVGEPVAAALKPAVPPEATVTLEGLLVTTGAALAADGQSRRRGGGGSRRLVNTASYWLPFSALVAVNE